MLEPPEPALGFVLVLEPVVPLQRCAAAFGLDSGAAGRVAGEG